MIVLDNTTLALQISTVNRIVPVGFPFPNRFERLELPVQHQGNIQFDKGLRALVGAQQQVPSITAEMVLAMHVPQFSFNWRDPGLEALSRFNQVSMDSVVAFEAMPAWLGNQYNPTGVTLVDSGTFGFQFAAEIADTATRIPGTNVLAEPTFAALLDAELAQPDWARSSTDSDFLWVFDHMEPQARRGQRSPDEIFEYLGLMPDDARMFVDLSRALEGLPVREVDEWLAEIDLSLLPSGPDVPPETGEEWLAQWFSRDTLPTWELLRELSVKPNSNGASPVTIEK